MYQNACSFKGLPVIVIATLKAKAFQKHGKIKIIRGTVVVRYELYWNDRARVMTVLKKQGKTAVGEKYWMFGFYYFVCRGKVL